MKCSVRTALLVVGGALACTPEDDPHPPYVAAHSAIVTDRGLYVLDIAPAEGRSWPRFPGPTTLAIHVDVGPDPAPNDPKFKTDDLPVPPLKLKAGPAQPSRRDQEETEARPWPVTPDGSSWRLAVDFTAAGDWSVPVRIRDANGHADDVDLVFRVEAKPR